MERLGGVPHRPSLTALGAAVGEGVGVAAVEGPTEEGREVRRPLPELGERPDGAHEKGGDEGAGVREGDCEQRGWIERTR